MLSRLIAQRRAALREGRDDGLTLAELVVAMTLLTIVLAVAGTFFTTAIRTTNTTTLTNQQSGDARQTLDSWTNMLRVATWLDSGQTDRFEEITPNKIVFYANLANRNTADFAVASVSKVVLMLKTTNATTGDGQLIEIVFTGNTSTPTYVRRVALNARAIAGAHTAVFTAFTYAGTEINPASYSGCKNTSTATVSAGLCLRTLPAGAGMADPTVDQFTTNVHAGNLVANTDPTQSSDSVLQSIAAIKIGFTVSDTSDTVNQTYQSMVAISSGFSS